jgi:hypothetical protein
MRGITFFGGVSVGSGGATQYGLSVIASEAKQSSRAPAGAQKKR